MKHSRASLFSGLVATLYLASVGTPSAQQRTTAALTLQDVIQRAVATAAAFEREFAAVVADEHFVQQNSIIAIVKSLSRREMRSDFLLVRVPGRDGWLPFRDVYEVDGRAVRDRTERLQNLFIDNPPTAVAAATQISNESSRYNIGTVIRTINVPTFGLLLLNPESLKRFEFSKRSEERISGVTTWRIAFEERARPTIVRTQPTGGNDVPLEGSLWIDVATGQVIIARSKELGFWVPATMTEWAHAENRSVVEGTAIYSRFRRFTVKTSETFQSR